jgi:hypothetical protein
VIDSVINHVIDLLRKKKCGIWSFPGGLLIPEVPTMSVPMQGRILYNRRNQLFAWLTVGVIVGYAIVSVTP